MFTSTRSSLISSTTHRSLKFRSLATSVRTAGFQSILNSKRKSRRTPVARRRKRRRRPKRRRRRMTMVRKRRRSHLSHSTRKCSSWTLTWTSSGSQLSQRLKSSRILSLSSCASLMQSDLFRRTREVARVVTVSCSWSRLSNNKELRQS